MTAITREVSPAFARCELTHLRRVPIDVDLARAQHDAYENALEDAGYRIERLTAGADMPDSVFIEDAAVVFDELAVVTRPGAASRRAETAAVAEALARHRPVSAIAAPGTLDGGDVLAAGRRVFVGVSTRTNREAIAQFRALLSPHRYTVCEVEIRGVLHLKSAVTAVADDALLINPDLIPASPFAGFECVAVDPSEPMAANVLRLRDRLVVPESFPRTAERLAKRGYTVVPVDVSELQKAEGAVTCCSLILGSARV
ncbi:MAG TPA: arginine deiminase family protein [Vicinamibacterales bacterium]|nr:arginine deiminase family protein [Vicinamibacterales bacterium]